jgi:predicted nucleic acid-binding protein
MRVVIDHNIVVDALKPNPKFAADAQEILRLASAKVMLQKLLFMLDIVGMEPADCVAALAKPLNDFEDALVDVCAGKIGADCVVSRDEALVKAVTDVEVIKPDRLFTLVRTDTLI